MLTLSVLNLGLRNGSALGKVPSPNLRKLLKYKNVSVILKSQDIWSLKKLFAENGYCLHSFPYFRYIVILKQNPCLLNLLHVMGKLFNVWLSTDLKTEY